MSRAASDCTGQQLIAVTGGGTGLGLVTANALADNGVKVYITGRRLEPLKQAAREASAKTGTGAIIPIQADASTKEGISREFTSPLAKRRD